MKKPLLVLASSAALGLAAAPALAQQTGGGVIDYFTGQLVWADVDDFDEALALALTAGKNIAPNFYLEGELTTTISDAEAEGAGDDIELSYWSFGAYGVYALPLGQDFALRGRLGGVYISADDEGGDSGLDDEFNVSFGVGGIYDLTPRLNLVAEYTRMDEDINHLSAGVQFKF
ncbi:MAG: outer membrane beta-barrel protein [Thiohalomonadaceae bacterium]